MEVLDKKESVDITNRNTTVDNLKGLLIILVVVGHTYSFCKNFIYLFHVGLFFVLSGYCFNQRYIETLVGLKELLLKRIKSLWIPYVVYNFVFLLLQNIFIKIGLLTTDPNYFSYNPFLSDGFCQVLTLKTAFIAFIKSLFFINSRPFAGGLWFLGGLFYITIGYAIIQYLLRKIHFERFHIAISFLLLVSGWLLVKFEIHIPFVKQLSIILICEILFTIGTYIKQFIVFPKLTVWYYIIGVVYFSVLTYFLSLVGNISIAGIHIENPFFYLSSILTGGALSYCFVKLFPFFSYIGKKTIPILALHPICFKLITFIQWKIYGGDKIILSLYPVWKNSILWTVVYVIVGVFIPLLICKIFSKSHIFKFLFKC